MAVAKRRLAVLRRLKRRFGDMSSVMEELVVTSDG